MSEETPSAYEQVGGDASVRALVDRFYDLMNLEPAYADLRAVHPPSLDAARDKLYWFLSGWLGGLDLPVAALGLRLQDRKALAASPTSPGPR